MTLPLSGDEVRSLPYPVRYRTFLLHDVGHSLLSGFGDFILKYFDPDV